MADRPAREMQTELTKMLCPICNESTSLLDVVDFNKSCEEARGKFLPLSGMPIYFRCCDNCFFSFAPAFWNWSDADFVDKIYNDEYVEVDPDYVEARPQANAEFLKKILGDQAELFRHLDYGGGNGRLSQVLKGSGWNSESYDPFPNDLGSIDTIGKFNLITAFEVFEHVPNVAMLMENLTRLMSDGCVVLFSTLISDGNIKPNERLSWWYASPRNGHISLFSKKSLFLLGLKHNLNLGSFSNGLHCFYRNVPSWAAHIIK
jgi:SAM-dependent methyltransferase